MTLNGRIVEYLENGRFVCAHVQDDNGTRLHLINQNHREVNLPHNRIIHFSQEEVPSKISREELATILHKIAQQRKKLAESISLHEVWELVSEKPGENFEVHFLASLFFGNDPTDDQTAAFLRAVIANRLYFKYKSGSIQVHSPETVAQMRLKQKMEKEQDDFTAANSKKLRRIWQKGEIPTEWKDRERVLQLLRDYYLFGKEASGHELAGKLFKSAQMTGPHDIFHLLVRLGIWDTNENIHLQRYAIPDSFSENVLAEAQKIAASSAPELSDTGRQDLRNLHLITIDGAATRDFDDALHLEKQGENYLVGIHISDVGYYVKPGTSVFGEALKRGTSIYFPEESISMLPPLLAEEKLSLLKDQERPALSFLVLLSPTAEILRFSVVHSIVSVKKQLTYSEADGLVKHDANLTAMATLSKLLRQRRVNKGALLLPMPELHIKIGPDDTIAINKTAVDTPSRILVAEFMILANTLGAQFVAEREAPGLFRSQMEPRQRIIDGFEKDILKIIQQRKRLSPMSLLTTPKNHSGVGAPQYTTVTSPIRRLLDLVMQLQISHLVDGKGVFFSKNDMKRFAGIIRTALEKVNQVKQLRQRYWILKYLEPKTGGRLPALVIESGPRRVHIFLEEFLLDADLPPKPAFKVTPGDIVMVKISRVDPLSNTLKLAW